MQRQRRVREDIDLGLFDDILCELDDWASGNSPEPAAPRQSPAPDRPAEPRAEAETRPGRAAIPAGARVLGLERGLYAVALSGAERLLAAIGVRVDALPGQPRGAVVVIPSDGSAHARSGWLCALPDLLIVKVRASTGRLLVTHYGGGLDPSAADLEIVPLDFCKPRLRNPGEYQGR